jgi:hypothetical protein
MFGKEVSVQKWVDKPALIQCACCHTLGPQQELQSVPVGQGLGEMPHVRRSPQVGGARPEVPPKAHSGWSVRLHALQMPQLQRCGHHCRET